MPRPSLDMITKTATAILMTLLASAVFSQESLTPTSSAIPQESASPLISPEESLTPPPLEQTPLPSPARHARISFVPPPLEGTISLGIYDKSGKLVRVLHQEAQLDEFTIGADALVTQWDGKDDDGRDLPAGKYHARGYAVGNLRIEHTNNSTPPADAVTNPNVRVNLVPNPLAQDQRQTISLGVGFDDENCFLETNDGLPLFTLDDRQNLVRASIKKSGAKSVDISTQDGNGAIVLLHVSNLDHMMAFDCGEFDLK